MNSIFAEKAETRKDLGSVASRIDEFCAFPSGHCRRVAALVDELAAASHLAERDRQYLEQSSMIRDIGEMAMRREYIASPRRLTTNEKIDLERHPVIGEREAAKLSTPRAVQLIIRWHHEWWNGSGYPDGLSGEQIPLAARILRVADSYTALTTDRPFRNAMSHDEAVIHLREWAAIEFDPQIVKSFIELDIQRLNKPVTSAHDPYGNGLSLV